MWSLFLDRCFTHVLIQEHKALYYKIQGLTVVAVVCSPPGILLCWIIICSLAHSWKCMPLNYLQVNAVFEATAITF